MSPVIEGVEGVVVVAVKTLLASRVPVRGIGDGLVLWVRVTPVVFARRSRAMALPDVVPPVTPGVTAVLMMPWLFTFDRVPLRSAMAVDDADAPETDETMLP